MIKRIESFDHFATADAAKKGWTFGASATVNAVTGRNSTGSFRCASSGAAGGALLAVTNTGATGIIGFAFKCAALPGTDLHIASVFEGGTQHLQLKLLATGALRVVRGTSTGTTLATSAGTPITGATFHFIEFAWTISDTVGTYEVKVNGASAIPAGSGADTRNAGSGPWNGIRLGGDTSAFGVTWDFDDLYVADDLTFRGDHRIVCLLPSTGAPGMHNAWTPSTGTDHAALVDDASPNTTDYVTTASAGYVETYNFPPVGVAGTVAGVQHNMYCKAEVAGVRLLKPNTNIGSIDYEANGALLPSDWTYVTEFFTTNPATVAPWTVAEIDAAEFGMVLDV